MGIDFASGQDGAGGTKSSNVWQQMKTYLLGMVLSARPDMVDCTKGGISNWCDFARPLQF